MRATLWLVNMKNIRGSGLTPFRQKCSHFPFCLASHVKIFFFVLQGPNWEYRTGLPSWAEQDWSHKDEKT